MAPVLLNLLLLSPGLIIIHTTFHAFVYQGIAVVVTEHNVGNTSSRLDPSSVLAVFKALCKGFRRFVVVIVIVQVVNNRVNITCVFITLNTRPY